LDIVETPIIEKLTVFGGLTFSNDLESIHLRFKIMAIRGGFLHIGTDKNTPFEGQAKITMFGLRNAEAI